MSMACTNSNDLRPWIETLVAYTCWISLFSLRLRAGLDFPALAASTARNNMGLLSRNLAAVQSGARTTAGYLLAVSHVLRKRHKDEKPSTRHTLAANHPRISCIAL